MHTNLRMRFFSIDEDHVKASLRDIFRTALHLGLARDHIRRATNPRGVCTQLIYKAALQICISLRDIVFAVVRDGACSPAMLYHTPRAPDPHGMMRHGSSHRFINSASTGTIGSVGDDSCAAGLPRIRVSGQTISTFLFVPHLKSVMPRTYAPPWRDSISPRCDHCLERTLFNILKLHHRNREQTCEKQSAPLKTSS